MSRDRSKDPSAPPPDGRAGPGAQGAPPTQADGSERTEVDQHLDVLLGFAPLDAPASTAADRDSAHVDPAPVRPSGRGLAAGPRSEGPDAPLRALSPAPRSSEDRVPTALDPVDGEGGPPVGTTEEPSLPSVLLSSGLFRAHDPLQPQTGLTQTDHRPSSELTSKLQALRDGQGARHPAPPSPRGQGQAVQGAQRSRAIGEDRRQQEDTDPGQSQPEHVARPYAKRALGLTVRPKRPLTPRADAVLRRRGGAPAADLQREPTDPSVQATPRAAVSVSQRRATRPGTPATSAQREPTDQAASAPDPGGASYGGAAMKKTTGGSRRSTRPIGSAGARRGALKADRGAIRTPTAQKLETAQVPAAPPPEAGRPLRGGVGRLPLITDANQPAAARPGVLGDRAQMRHTEPRSVSARRLSETQTGAPQAVEQTVEVWGLRSSSGHRPAAAVATRASSGGLRTALTQATHAAGTAPIPPATSNVPRPGVRGVGPAGGASGLFRNVSVVTLILLFEAVALPSAAGAPWVLLGDPSGVTFVSLAFLLLVLVVQIAPVSGRHRAAGAVGVGALMLVFSLLVGGASVASFGGQPALTAVFGGPVGGRLVLMVVVTVLLGGLAWRAVDRRGTRTSRVLIGVGVALAALIWLLGQVLGLADGAPIAGIFSDGTGAPFLGDRIVAWAGLLPVGALALAGAAALPRGTRRAAGLALWVTWGLAIAPLLVGCLFVAKSDAWVSVLGPIKVVTFCAAAVLYAGAAIGLALSAPARRSS